MLGRYDRFSITNSENHKRNLVSYIQKLFTRLNTLPYADKGDDGAAAASDILLESGDVEVIYSNGAGYIAQIGG